MLGVVAIAASCAFSWRRLEKYNDVLEDYKKVNVVVRSYDSYCHIGHHRTN